MRVILRARHKLDYNQPDDFSLITDEVTEQLFGQITGTVAAVAFPVVGISLVIGGIVIMNIMLATVTERTREIGIRKSLGATRRDILVQFLVESAMLSGLGGMIGLLLRDNDHDDSRQLRAGPCGDTLLGARHRDQRVDAGRRIFRTLPRAPRGLTRSDRGAQSGLESDSVMHIQEIGENVFMALDTLRTHKVRSALTMLGVIGGTMTVIAISSFLTGLKQFVISQTERFGPDLVFISKYDNIGIRFSRPSQAERMRKEVTVEDAEAIAELPAVAGVSPTIVVGSFAPAATQPVVKYKGVEASRPIIFGVWSNYDQIRNVYIKSGASLPRRSSSTRPKSRSSGRGSPKRSTAGLSRSNARLKSKGRSTESSA